MSDTKPVTKDDELVIDIRDGRVDNVRWRDPGGTTYSFMNNIVVIIDGNYPCIECGEPGPSVRRGGICDECSIAGGV